MSDTIESEVLKVKVDKSAKELISDIVTNLQEIDAYIARLNRQVNLITGIKVSEEPFPPMKFYPEVDIKTNLMDINDITFTLSSRIKTPSFNLEQSFLGEL